MAIISSATITFSGLSDLQNYITLNGVNSLSTKTLILNTNPNATSSIENTYSLNDLFPSGKLSSSVKIIVGSGATLTDDWSKVYTDPLNSTNPTVNISTITLEAGATLRAGHSAAYPSEGVFDKTDIYFDSNVSTDTPAYIESIYYPNKTQYGNGSLSQKKLRLHTKDQSLIGYTNDFYDPTKSGLQFRVVDENGDLVSDSIVNTIVLKATNSTTESSTITNGVDSLITAYNNLPTYIFDESIANSYYVSGNAPSTIANTFFNYNDDTYKCFLEGTEIKTTKGWKKIEEIDETDKIITYNNGEEIVKKIVWIGRSLLNSRSSLIIQIKQHAFKKNVPYKDLYVTPEHCLFIDNYFVPARMLVNGRSICQNFMKDKFVYHIQLENHSVINAHGLMTESFLNTENFQVKMCGSGIPMKNQSWDNDAAYPLNTQRAFVEKIYKKLENRAIEQGLKKNTKPLKITQDTSIEFIGSDNKKLPFVIYDYKYILYVQPNIKNITIRSNASRPSEAIGPFVDDRRKLGVLISSIKHITSKKYNDIQIAADDYNWYINEGGLKWTNGKSMIEIEPQNNNSIVVIDLIAQNDAYII